MHGFNSGETGELGEYGHGVALYRDSKMSLIRRYSRYQLVISIVILTGSEVVPKFIWEKFPHCITFRESKIHVLLRYDDHLNKIKTRIIHNLIWPKHDTGNVVIIVIIMFVCSVFRPTSASRGIVRCQKWYNGLERKAFLVGWETFMSSLQQHHNNSKFC